MTSHTTLHRHPIRGFIWGLVFGLGVTGLLMVFSIVELSIPNLIIYTAVGAVVGLLWGLFAPAKKPKGAPPAAPSWRTSPTESAPLYEETFPPSAASEIPPMAETADASTDERGEDNEDTAG